MDFFKRLFIGVILFTSMIVISLLGVAFATNYWIVATATRNVIFLTTTTTGTIVPTPEIESEDLQQNSGKVNFGLFKGYKILNRFGLRSYNLSIVCSASEGVCMWADDKHLSNSERQDQIRNEIFKLKNSFNTTGEHINLAKEGFFNFYLWVSVVVLLSLAAFLDLVAIGFSVLNFVTVPVSTLTGMIGLYVWNGLSAIFSFGCVIMWAVLYHLEFTNNVMSPMDIKTDWSTTDAATFGYSFWMVVGAGIISVANLILIFASTFESWTIRRANAALNEKPADGIIMLY